MDDVHFFGLAMGLDSLAAKATAELSNLNQFIALLRKYEPEIQNYYGVADSIKKLLDGHSFGDEPSLPDLDEDLALLSSLSKKLLRIWSLIKALTTQMGQGMTGTAIEQGRKLVDFCIHHMTVFDIRSSLAKVEKEIESLETLVVHNENDARLKAAREKARLMVNDCKEIKDAPWYMEETYSFIESFVGDENKLFREVKKRILTIKDIARLYNEVGGKIELIKDYYPRNGKKEVVDSFGRITEKKRTLLYKDVDNVVEGLKRIGDTVEIVKEKFKEERDGLCFFSKIPFYMRRKDKKFFKKEVERLQENLEYVNYSEEELKSKWNRADTIGEFLSCVFWFIVGIVLVALGSILELEILYGLGFFVLVFVFSVIYQLVRDGFFA